MENKLKVLLTTVLLFVAALSCDERKYLPTPPTEPPKPPGYQEDIPWPSLADSPWPMNHHDPQSTGRSKYIGPLSGKLKNKIFSGELQNSLVITQDNKVVFSPTRSEKSLLCTDINGNIVWSIDISSDEIFTTPLIASDGTIYFYTRIFNSWSLYAASKDGEIKWSYKPEGGLEQLGINIGLDGTLYFVDGLQNLVALGPDGQELWKYYDERFYGNLWSSLTFSPDGNSLYIQGFNNQSLISFNINEKKVEWTFGTAPLYNSPVVSSDGNIYIFPSFEDSSKTSSLFCLYPDGSIKWEYRYIASGFNKYLNLDPTLDINGNVYFGFDTLYCIDYDGRLNWKYGLSDNIYSPLICDIQSNIYVGMANKIIALDNLGTKKWELQIEEERSLGMSPAITYDRLLLYPMFRSDNIIVIE